MRRFSSICVRRQLSKLSLIENLLLSYVFHEILLHVTFPWKSLIACFKKICLFRYMRLEMVIEVKFLWKSFLTNFRNMRYFICVSGNASLGHFSMKILSYKVHKHEVFPLYEFEGDSLGCFSLKIFYYKFHNHEAFDLYVSGDASSGPIYVKILYYKFHKHETFHMYVYGNGSLSYVRKAFVKNFWNITLSSCTHF